MKKIISLFAVFCFLLSFASCIAQTTYHELSQKHEEAIPTSFFSSRENLVKIGKDLSEYLPLNYSMKGKDDYTLYLQRGIDKGGILLLPNFPVLINDEGLVLKSNTKLVFQENSKLIMKPNSKTHYTVLDLRDIDNVDIYFANIQGDREGHLITKGEWGMGIRIQGAKNINIFAPKIIECWGDGIYVGAFGKRNSENINIYNPNIYKARRNGISVISVKGLQINDGLISNTYGTAPQSAIDFEPNKPINVLQNIIVKNVTTHNSKGDGILMSLSNLTLKSEAVSNKAIGKVSIYVENHLDIGSTYAVRINGREKGSSKAGYRDFFKLGGEIVFINSKWIRDNDILPIRFSPNKNRVLNYGFNPNVQFKKIDILDFAGKKISDENGKVNLINKE